MGPQPDVPGSIPISGKSFVFHGPLIEPPHRYWLEKGPLLYGAHLGAYC